LPSVLLTAVLAHCDAAASRKVHATPRDPPHAYPALLDEIVDGRLDPSLLVHRTISLEEAGQALATMDAAPRTGATVVVV
jgi:threonine dehydrogenase-like Zn-dependent dehydrogenase